MDILISEILYFGTTRIFACDRKCEKAWGINRRPKVQLDPDNHDDYYFPADQELDTAPRHPGTSEGGDLKPFHPAKHNRWCVRECERSARFDIGETVEVRNFNERVYNIIRP